MLARSLVSSYKGPITRLLMVVPAIAADHFADIYLDILRHLPAQARLDIIVQSIARKSVERWLAQTAMADRADLHEIADDVELSIWAQDSFLAARGEGGGPVMLKPAAFERYDDAQVASILAGETDMTLAETPLMLEGGNVLVGHDRVLVGGDCMARSVKALDASTKNGPLGEIFRDQFDGRRALTPIASHLQVPEERSEDCTIIGEAWTQTAFYKNKPGTTQPIFHLDMFLTLAGRNDAGSEQILVGDPRLAANLLGKPLAMQAMADHFDDIAAGLTKLGFAVLRNPLPLLYMDEVEKKRRTWFFATSNNLWVEDCGPGARRVWLPTYGHDLWPELSNTDDANAMVWEKLGYDVIRLGNFLPLAENLGALHCMGKVLARR